VRPRANKRRVRSLSCFFLLLELNCFLVVSQGFAVFLCFVFRITK
jgi:hypothetical protein